MGKQGKKRSKRPRVPSKQKQAPGTLRTSGEGVERLDISVDDLRAIVERTKSGPLSDEDRIRLGGAVDTLAVVTAELEAKTASLRRLRRLIFGPTSEKTRDVLGQQGEDQSNPTVPSADGNDDVTEQPAGATDTAEKAQGKAGDDKGEDQKPPKRKGHGRRSAKEYTGAERIKVPHQSLKHKAPCPECLKGKVYLQSEPAVLVRVTGVAPLSATVYECERLRCNLCGEVFTAERPEDVGPQKYDETAAAMIGLMKYGCGMPFNRLEGLEGSLGIPLPASTQWEVVEPAALKLMPVLMMLIWQAAQGKVLHNDDTTARILELQPKKAEGEAEGDQEQKKERTGLYTSGIVSISGGHRIAMFFTGRQHAGENLADVLRQRASELGPPLQMSDAMPANQPGDQTTIACNCNSHARRRFVDVYEKFPEEVAHVLKVFKDIYANDDWTKEQAMSDEDRLRYHQQHSAPLMDSLKGWLKEQFDQKKVEPNSTLGEAINYMTKHWDKLTRFLHVPGAPLDNNLCERILKKAILHRKNALFFKTTNGACVGDLFMTLIHTCELEGVNPFEYLVTLLRHHEELADEPGRWLPWNYQANLNEPGIHQAS